MLVNLDLSVSIDEFKDFEVVFSPDLGSILIDDKAFLNLRQGLQSQPLSLPQNIRSVNQGQPDTDELIQWQRTMQFSISSCKKYIAINHRIQTDSGVTARLEVYNVDSSVVSCICHESVEKYLRRCTGLQIDFHPCSPKLALILWEETEEKNKLGHPCERVRCIIWDLETDDVSSIGEMYDFSASYSKYYILQPVQTILTTDVYQVFRDPCHELQDAKFSECGSSVTLYWHRRTRHEFLLPGHKPTPNSVSPLPCMLACHPCLNWNDKFFKVRCRVGTVYLEIQQPDPDGGWGSSHEEYLTSIPSRFWLWKATLLNGDEKNPNLRVLLTQDGGLAEIKRLRITWDEVMLKFPLKYRS